MAEKDKGGSHLRQPSVQAFWGLRHVFSPKLYLGAHWRISNNPLWGGRGGLVLVQYLGIDESLRVWKTDPVYDNTLNFITLLQQGSHY